MPDQPPLRIGVLAIQGDYDAHATALRDVGAEAVLVRKPGQLDELDGLVIPGGESTTFLKFLERDGFLDHLQSFVRTRPTFGTCAGCILLAKEVQHHPELSGPSDRRVHARFLDMVRTHKAAVA